MSLPGSLSLAEQQSLASALGYELTHVRLGGVRIAEGRVRIDVLDLDEYGHPVVLPSGAVYVRQEWRDLPEGWANATR